MKKLRKGFGVIEVILLGKGGPIAHQECLLLDKLYENSSKKNNYDEVRLITEDDDLESRYWFLKI